MSNHFSILGSSAANPNNPQNSNSNDLITKLNQLNDSFRSSKLSGKSLNELVSVCADLKQQTTLNRPSYLKILNAVFNLLDTISEIDPDSMEMNNEDLKTFRKNNKKSNLADFFAFKSNFFSYQFNSQNNDSSQISKISSQFTTGTLLSNVMLLNKQSLDKVNLLSSSFNIDLTNISFLSDLTPEEIEQLIYDLLAGGISDLEELETILKLLGELGLHVSNELLMEIADAIQEFLESEAAQITDPMALYQLVHMIQVFSSQDICTQLNFESIGNQLTDLLNSLPEESGNVLPNQLTSFVPQFYNSKDLNQFQQVTPIEPVPQHIIIDKSQNTNFLEEQIAGIVASGKTSFLPNELPKETEAIQKVNKIEKSTFEINPPPKSQPLAEQNKQNENLEEGLNKLYEALDILLEQQTEKMYTPFLELLRQTCENQLKSSLNKAFGENQSS